MRKNTFLSLTTLIVIIAIITFACKKSSNTIPPTKYFATVRTILTTYCGTTTCHGNGAGPIELGDSATLVSNNNPAKIKDRITRDNNAIGVMPPSGSSPLTAGAKDTLIRWVDAGGKGNN